MNMMSSKVPKVSVIMAVYNGARYLREAVESILNQTFTDFEFIIVDDGSTDETQTILNSYHDPRIVRLRNVIRCGASSARNRALTMVRGIYVAVQDADDVSYSIRLEREVNFLDRHPEIGLLGSAYDMVDKEGKVVGRISPPTDNTTLQRTLVRHNCFGHGSIMVRCGLIKQIGGYWEELPVVHDYELYLRASEQTSLANLIEPLYAWRLHESSLTHSFVGKQRELDMMKSLKRMLARRATPRPGVPGWAPEDLAAARVVLAVSAALLEEWATARQALHEAWQLAGEWLEGGGFVEVAEEALWGAANWAGWTKIFAALEGLLTCLPSGRQLRHIDTLFARLYRHWAFKAHMYGQAQQVRRAAWAYWRLRPLALFTDRGMASIWLQSWRGGARA